MECTTLALDIRCVGFTRKERAQQGDKGCMQILHKESVLSIPGLWGKVGIVEGVD